MDRNEEVAGTRGFLRRATRAVGSTALLAMGLFAVPSWATCLFSAPTERDNTGENGWVDVVKPTATATTATKGDIVYVVGDTTAVTLPAIADVSECDGEGDVEVTLYKNGVLQTVASTDTDILRLLTVDDADPGATDSVVTAATEAGANTLLATGAPLTYSPTGTAPGFHNAAPVAYQLRAEKAFSGGDRAVFDFTITIRPAALGVAPSNVQAYSETATSIYVEWSGDGNNADATATPPTADTTAEAYEIEYSWTPSGTNATRQTRQAPLVTDTATAGTVQGDSVRQYATLTGLTAGTAYTITVKGVKGKKPYADRVSAATAVVTDPVSPLTTRAPYYNPSQSRAMGVTTARPYKISVGETQDLEVKDLIYIALPGAAANPDALTNPDGTVLAPLTDDEGRGSATAATDPQPTFTFTVAGGNSDSLRVEYLNDGDTNNADDLVRLTGLKEAGIRTVTITATSSDSRSTPARVTTLTGQMQVEVLENFAPMFAISEANVNWNVSTTGGNDPLDFEIHLMDDFVTDEIADANDCVDGQTEATEDCNASHELTFSMAQKGGTESGSTNWFEIDDETGVISVKGPTSATQTTAQYLERVKEGDQFELTVTATDQSGAKDTMTIFVDAVGEDNDAPKLRSPTGNEFWLQPMTEAGGGGTRTQDVGVRFSDEEGDDLCFEIRSSTLTDTEDNKLADAALGGASGCHNDTLAITMRLPSTDPEDDDFPLLGKYGRETVSVTVGAYQRGSNPKVSTSGAVTVMVYLVYGQNEGPLIRSVAQVTGSDTYVTSGGHEINEGANIELTFTADDAQPTGDALCWRVGGGSCTPCTGNPSEDRIFTTTTPRTRIHRRSSSDVDGAAHEYELFIQGTITRPLWQGGGSTQITDYERYNGVYTVRLCASDLAGETHRISFNVKLKDVEEAPELDDIDDLYMVVGDDSTVVDLTKYASDGDGKDDIVSYDANCIVDCRRGEANNVVTIAEADGVLTITPTTRELGDDEKNDSVTVEIEASTTDSTGLTAYETFEVTVKDRNAAPQFDGGLASISYTVPENSGVGTAVGEPLAISDVNSADRLSVKITGSSNFSARIVTTSPANAEEEDITQGVQIQVAKSGMDFESERNTFDINVQIEDNYGGRDSIDAHIALTDKNEAPELIGESDDIPDMMILDGLTRCVVDASEHFEDQDNRDQQAGLLIDASSTRPSDVVVSIVDNNDVCITGKNVGSGASRIKVTATDREDLQVSKTFRVSVEENMPPMVVDEGIPDASTQEGGNTGDMDLSMYFDDGDMLYEENLTYSFTMDDPGDVATGALVGDGSMLRVYGDTKGLVDVTVTATDEKGQSVSDMFEVQVVRNYAPMADADEFMNVEQYIGKEYDPIDATEVFTDEGDELEYSVTTSDPDVATAAIKYDEMELPWIVIHLHSPGTIDVTMTATDSAQQTASASFTVIVHPRNDPPTIAMAIADVELIELRSFNIDLEPVFADDHDMIDIVIVNEDETIADVVHRTTTNMIRVYGNEPGTTTVAVTATDDIGQSVVDVFDVVIVPNHAPVVANKVDAQPVFINRSITVELEGVFSDENGDPLDLTAESANEDVATVSLDGTTLTINGITIDTTTIVLTATDPGELSVQHVFEIEVLSDSPNVVEGNELPDQTLTVVMPVMVDVAATFEDPEDEVLTYSAESADEDVATVMMDGSMLTVTGMMVGMTSVTVTATDPYDNTAMDTFDVTVINAMPMSVGEIENQTLTVVDPVMISIAETFSDPDGDELTYSATSSNTEAATVSLDGTDLTITGVKVGMTTITVSAMDPDGLMASAMFEAEVVNAAPMLVMEIDDQTMTVVEPIRMSIDDNFMDPDGDELSFTASSSNEAAATVSVETSFAQDHPGTYLTITGVKVGTTTITLTAMDPDGLYAMDVFVVEVENAAPMVVNEIDDQTLTVVDPAMVSIADTFMDPDGDELTYKAMSSNEDAATVSLYGTDLTITGVKVGTTTITVTAMDPAGLYAMTSFEAEVENAAPMLVNEIADQTMTVVEPIMISIADTFMDPDGDELTFMATSSNEAAATVSVEMSHAQTHPDAYLMITAVKVGTTTITVTAMDPGGLYAMDSFEVEVENAAPMLVSEIDDQKLTVVDPITISVADNFMDPDGDPLTFMAVSSNEAAATVRVNDADITITAVKVGFTNVTVTASDPDGLSVADTFEVEVENAAPMMVGTLDDQVVTRGEPLTFSIAGVFMDPDGDPLTNTAGSADSSIATATVSGDSVTLDGLAPGTTKITITASDPDGLSASGSFSVRVETIPEAVGTIANITLQIGGDSAEMDIAQYFEDDDGDTLSYAVTSSSNAATASLSGADLTVAPFTRGSSTITLTASDPKGRSATQSFTATVSDSELRNIAEMTLAHHGRAVLSSVSAVLGARLESDRMDTGMSFGRFTEYLPTEDAMVRLGDSPLAYMQQFNHSNNVNNSTTSSMSWGSNNGGTMQTPIGSPTESSAPRLNALFNPLTSKNFSKTLNGNGGIGSFSVWGGFDAQSFEGDGYSGDATSLFLGVDVQTNVCWLFGVSIASNTGESDYMWGSATQTMETSLTTILPYVRYQPTDGKSSFYGVFGSGSGEAESTVVNASNQTSDLSLNLGLGGMRYEFAEAGNFDLAFRGDIGFASIETASGDGAIDGLAADVNRIRAGVEASMQVDPGNGGSVVPFGELAVRNDGGDGVTGSGLEVAGGIRFSQDQFSLEARGRLTAAHGGEEFSEQGISVVAAFQPAQDGTGFSMSVAPSWGSTSSRHDLVWSETTMIGVSSALPETNVLRSTNGRSIDTTLGYGFRVSKGRFMLVPSLRANTGSADVMSTLIGVELKQLIQAPRSVYLNFAFGEVEDRYGSDRQIGLDLRILF